MDTVQMSHLQEFKNLKKKYKIKKLLMLKILANVEIVSTSLLEIEMKRYIFEK